MVNSLSKRTRGASRNDSAVPMGLAAEVSDNPGTEVPGYSRRVPDGTQICRSDHDPLNKPGAPANPTQTILFGSRKYL